MAMPFLIVLVHIVVVMFIAQPLTEVAMEVGLSQLEGEQLEKAKETMKSMGAISTVIRVTTQLVVAVLTWCLYSFLFWLITYIFDKQAKYLTFVKLIGYAFLFSIIINIIFYFQIKDADWSAIQSISDLEIWQENYQKQTLPYSVCSALLSSVFVLFGVKNIYELSWVKSAIVGLVPFLLIAGYSLIQVM